MLGGDSVGYLKKPYPENFVDSVFTKREQVTLANTTEEVSLVGYGTGSTLFPADYFFVGKTLEIKTAGILSGTNNDTGTIRIYLGENEIVESVATFPATITNAQYDMWFTLTCISANTFIGQGYTRILAGVGLQTAYTRPIKLLSPITIATNQAYNMDITYQWSAARTTNSITSTNGYILAIK